MNQLIIHAYFQILNFEVDTKRDVFDLFDNPIRQGDKTVYWRRSSENTGKYRFS